MAKQVLSILQPLVHQKIMGLEVIKKLAIKQAAIASFKDNPRAIPTGAAASAVAPDMTKPCKNSAVNNLE
jgi:hypothetical protein